jgi:hypothetical protein
MHRKILKCLATGLLMSLFFGCSGDDGNSPPVTLYGEIAPFSEGMASVQLNQKWGFIDPSGDLVIPAEYADVKPFSDGLAACRVSGRWFFINTKGERVFDRGFFRAGKFSEGLAAVKEQLQSSWGYINQAGVTVIPAQFKSAGPFKDGLAPVKKGGNWRYIDMQGNDVLVTNFHQAFHLSEDGLALVRVTQNGKFGYIDKGGNLKIPANFDVARHFAHGLAAVRVGDKWGYIDTEGRFAVQPEYEVAFDFSEDMAAVMEGNKFQYILKDGQRIFPENSFDYASPFSDGLALILDSGTYQYINTQGRFADVARARKRAEPGGIGDDPSCIDYESIFHAYQSGFVFFRLFNVGDLAWDITVDKKWDWEKNECVGISNYDVKEGYTALPGFPATLEQAGSSSGYYRSFMLQFVTALYCKGSCNKDAKPGPFLPLFDMTLESTDKQYSLQLANEIVMNPPPLNPGNSFWQYLVDGANMIFGEFGFIKDPIKGLWDYVNGVYGLIDGGGTDNQLTWTEGTFLKTTLTGTKTEGSGTHALESISINACGGDEYTISDGTSLVAEITAGRSKSAPGDVGLGIYQYNTFWALQAAVRLNQFRNSPNSQQYEVSPYSDILEVVFDNYMDTKNDKLCENTGGTEGYPQTVSAWTSEQIDAFWKIANDFDNMCDPKAATSAQCADSAKLFSYKCTGGG